MQLEENIKKSDKCRNFLTFEFVEDSPKFSNVSGKCDVCVKDNYSLQVWRQRLSEHELHQAVDSRVMFVRDPWHLRLKHDTKAKLELISFGQNTYLKLCGVNKEIFFFYTAHVFSGKINQRAITSAKQDAISNKRLKVTEVWHSWIHHLQFVSIIKVDSDSRDHPGMKKRGQDLLSNGVCDKMEMEWVPPVDTHKNTSAKLK